MNRIWIFFICLFFIVFNLNAGVVLFKASGKYEVLNDKGEKVELKAGDELYENYTVITYKDSEVQIIIDDDNLVAVSANSKIKVSDVINKKDNSSLLDMIYGKATFIINKLMDGKFKVGVPNAVIGVRGTSFSVISDSTAEKTEVGLFKGMVELEKDGKIVNMKPGQSAIISKIDLKIQNRLSGIMLKEKNRALKLERYFNKVRKNMKKREMKIKEKLEKMENKKEKYQNKEDLTEDESVSEMGKNGIEEEKQNIKEIGKEINRDINRDLKETLQKNKEVIDEIVKNNKIDSNTQNTLPVKMSN